MLRLIVNDSEESADESTDEHTPTLESVIGYLHGEAQLAQSQNEHEDFSISLRLLGLLRDGWSGGPGLLDVACGYAFQVSHARYVHSREARAALQHQQLLRLIPDYDYSNEKPPKDDPTDGRRKYHGNRYDRGRDLDTSTGPRHDATTTSEPTANYAAASWAMGDRPNAEGRHPASSLARAAGRPGVPDAYRGSVPLRVSSPAQRKHSLKAVRTMNAVMSARRSQTYCGA